MSTSGSLTDWLRSLSGTPFAALAREAAEVPAGARGLLVLPYFAGERSPLFDPHARGVVAGLTLDHGRAELARAIYEAIGYGVRHNLEAFAAAGAPGSRVVAVGGGTKNPLWTQVVSSIAGVAQEVPRVTTGAAYGDALLAGIAAGIVAPETDWTVADTTVTPVRRRRRRLRAAVRRLPRAVPRDRGDRPPSCRAAVAGVVVAGEIDVRHHP